ncbi:MAG: DUF3558 family protein [Pseudonocardia sp.]|nr:DUF3558 family protein [Pseudonocardia sp.]
MARTVAVIPTTRPTAQPAIAAAAIATLVVSLLGGCASDQVPSAPHSTAIINPLDPTAAEANPCSLLATARLQALHLVPPGTIQLGPTGPVCTWTSHPPDQIVLTAGVEGGRQFPDVSAQHAGDAFTQFLAVGGYRSILDSDGPPAQTGVCQLTIEIAPTTLLTVHANTHSEPVGTRADPCVTAQQVARFMLGQLGVANP